jgi:hypothetical protein
MLSCGEHYPWLEDKGIVGFSEGQTRALTFLQEVGGGIVYCDGPQTGNPVVHS